MKTKLCPSCQSAIPIETDQCSVCGLSGLNQGFFTEKEYGTWVKDGLVKHQELRKPVEISVGPNHAVILMKNGDLYAIGNNRNEACGGSGLPQVLTTPTRIAQNVASASAGKNHTIYCSKDGTVTLQGCSDYVDRFDCALRAEKVYAHQYKDEFLIKEIGGGYYFFGANYEEHVPRSVRVLRELPEVAISPEWSIIRSYTHSQFWYYVARTCGIDHSKFWSRTIDGEDRKAMEAWGTDDDIEAWGKDNGLDSKGLWVLSYASDAYVYEPRPMNAQDLIDPEKTKETAYVASSLWYRELLARYGEKNIGICFGKPTGKTGKFSHKLPSWKLLNQVNLAYTYKPKVEYRNNYIYCPVRYDGDQYLEGRFAYGWPRHSWRGDYAPEDAEKIIYYGQRHLGWGYPNGVAYITKDHYCHFVNVSEDTPSSIASISDVIDIAFCEENDLVLLINTRHEVMQASLEKIHQEGKFMLRKLNF